MLLPENERLPVVSTDFWRGRIYNAVARGRDLHTIIYDTDYSNWKEIQNETGGIIKGLVHSGQRVLDAGCGYGSIFDCFKRVDDYWGIDISPDLIEIGKIRNPHIRLAVGDLRSLPQFEDRFFDLVVCRSVKSMLLDNAMDDVWDQIYLELKRVGKKILLMEYGVPMIQEIVDV